MIVHKGTVPNKVSP